MASEPVYCSLCMLIYLYLSMLSVSTLAGSNVGADGGWIDGAGAAAAFSSPTGVAVDPFGNVLVADHFNYRLRRVTPNGCTWRRTYVFTPLFLSASSIVSVLDHMRVKFVLLPTGTYPV